MEIPYTTTIKTDSKLLFCNLNEIDYRQAMDLQLSIVRGINRGEIHHDFLLVLEHPPVFTLGKNGGIENLVVSESFLKEKNINTVQIERGGNITYHGPGQLVVYPILNLKKMGLAVKDYVKGLEEVMIRTAADFGISAERNEKNHGIWIKDRKLGSIGLAIKHGVSFHGLAMNINMSLEPFSWINPCGLAGVSMTSLELESKNKISMTSAVNRITDKFTDVFGFVINEITKKDLDSMREAA